MVFVHKISAGKEHSFSVEVVTVRSKWISSAGLKLSAMNDAATVELSRHFGTVKLVHKYPLKK